LENEIQPLEMLLQRNGGLKKHRGGVGVVEKAGGRRLHPHVHPEMADKLA
jgi:hypothetical protein